jgi:E3 ubiquitin-protein ligase BRE1
MDMLIQEVERLSSAWATLDEQNRDKVLALVSFEEKMTRLTSEVRRARPMAKPCLSISVAESQGRQPLLCGHASQRGPPDRADGAPEDGGEPTQGHRNDERGADVVDGPIGARVWLPAPTKRADASLQTATEKEVGLHLTNNRAYQDRISELEGAVTEKDLEVQSKERQLNEVRRSADQPGRARLEAWQVQSLLSERTAHGEGDAASVRQLQEQVAKLERELAVAKTSSKAAHRRGGADEELKQHNDDLTVRPIGMAHDRQRLSARPENAQVHVVQPSVQDARHHEVLPLALQGVHRGADQQPSTQVPDMRRTVWRPGLPASASVTCALILARTQTFAGVLLVCTRCAPL